MPPAVGRNWRSRRTRRPGTDVVVYGSSTASGEETTIVMYRLTDGKRVRTGLTGHGALAMIDDRLVYAQSDGTLMAVAVDTRSMSVRGEPIRLTTRVAHGAPGTAVALSRSGVLVYRPGGAAAVSRLELVDMTGRSRTVHASSPFVGSPRFSRDGRRVAVAMAVDGGVSRNFRVTTADVWTIDLTNGEATRVTSNNEAGQPSWFPDGQRLLYVKAIGGGFEVHSHRLDGGSPSSRLLTLDDTPYAADVAADGRTLVVRTSYRNSTVQGALLRVSLGDDARVDTLITATVKLRPEYVRISPDGQWICFVDRSTYEVWVRSLRDSSMMMVSTTVSLDSPPVWGPDSRTLYYRSAAGMSMIELNTTPRLSVARRGVVRGLPTLGAFDMSPDGREFVMLAPTQRSGGAVIAVDWANEARREWSRSTRK